MIILFLFTQFIFASDCVPISEELQTEFISQNLAHLNSVLCERDGQFFLHLVNIRPTCVGSTSNCPATLVCPGDFPVLQAVDLKAAIPHPNAIHPDCPDKSCLDETCSRHGTCSEGHCICDVGYEGEKCEQNERFSEPFISFGAGLCADYDENSPMYYRWDANDCECLINEAACKTLCLRDEECIGISSSDESCYVYVSEDFDMDAFQNDHSAWNLPNQGKGFYTNPYPSNRTWASSITQALYDSETPDTICFLRNFDYRPPDSNKKSTSKQGHGLFFYIFICLIILCILGGGVISYRHLSVRYRPMFDKVSAHVGRNHYHQLLSRKKGDIDESGMNPFAFSAQDHLDEYDL